MSLSYVRGVFDLESNGFLYEADRIWCIVLKDLEDHSIHQFPPDKIEDGLQLLSRYKYLIGHNICQFDINLIKKLYPDWTYRNLRDTLCMAKLFDPDRFGGVGSGLEYFGKMFKRYKPAHEEWDRYSEEMLHRCTEDVEINVLTYEYLVNRYTKGWSWIESLLLEQEFAIECGIQELAGVDVDTDLAFKVVDEIDQEVSEIDPILLSRMPKRVVPKGKPVNKVFLKAGGYTKAVEDWFA